MTHPPVPNGERARIVDVAAMAGVSPGTVSNTLNHPQRVNEETRRRVMEAIDQLGFVRNNQARVLTGAPSTTLGLIVLDLKSPFFMELAHAVERAASALGHVVIMCNSENDQARETQLLELLASERVAGALVTPAGGRNPVPGPQAGPPLVLLDLESPDHPCSVRVDHVEGARQAARHLIEFGHRRLAFIGGLADLGQFQQRVVGMELAMAEAGLDPESLVVIRSEGINLESGEASAARLLDMADRPTGVCCGNDMLAFGVYRALDRAGVRVPQDIALVGYDDVAFAANWIVPLTTVRQPTREMGRRAAELLLDHATGTAHEHQRVVLTPELIVRRSSGAYE
ncbi:MAG: LacI family DNA-binding transcriptional regulator [Tessaracoccus sp.]|uniref:LacI family DNA-binding transcriptional regulator n=1 Tax=Tessaracoccus sp. TaxID=1971211 RepID=UPI001ECCE79D|nr:LacI family DNA-binding transcriptional regulator [Tessaracoccus sp.]MBK7822720.1 LacI family DNA-binding transcriptional regulator [Tessaracoccus sp.]